MNPIEALLQIKALVDESDILKILADEKLKKAELVEQIGEAFEKLTNEINKIADEADREIDFDSENCDCVATGNLSTEMMFLDAALCDEHGEGNLERIQELEKLTEEMLEVVDMKDPLAKTTYPTNKWWEIARVR